MCTWFRDVIIVSCGSNTTTARRTRLLVQVHLRARLLGICSQGRPRQVHVVLGPWGPWPPELEGLLLVRLGHHLRANVRRSNVALLHQSECGHLGRCECGKEKRMWAFAQRRVWQRNRAVCFAYKTLCGTLGLEHLLADGDHVVVVIAELLVHLSLQQWNVLPLPNERDTRMGNRTNCVKMQCAAI